MLIATSAVTLTELMAFPKITSTEEHKLKSFLRTTRVVPVDWHIAELAGHLKRQYGMNIADSFIAATAWQTGTTLITRNIRDFRISEISVRAI